MTNKESVEKQYEFKAEVKQLLNILVHSLYTNREIFLRELISNSSDALDKLRFESNRGTEIIQNDLPLEIKIEFDSNENTLTITDSGIGMTESELVENIGTIAKSGTTEFLKKLAESKSEASNIIGKFGVGFYSVFMVAEKVELTTKSFKPDSEALVWTSDGLGSYTISKALDKSDRGTKIKIFLKEETKDFADKYKLEQIIKKHSNFITFPIKIDKDQLNTVTAIWREPKSFVKKEQYNEFYKFLTYDNEEPLEVIHKSVDAPIQFNCLLFISKKNFDIFGMNRGDYGLDLYVKRVLIQHKNKELLPEYLSFVRGVVDSEDLPLNISRETLQENLVFTKIANTVTSQILSTLSTLAKDNVEKYNEFWKEHGRILKMGYSDYANLEKISNLLRFNSSSCETAEELTSFDEYVKRIKEGQKDIYYITGASRDALHMDPHTEIFKAKGLEVIYLFDPADEFVFSNLNKVKDFELKSADQVELKSLEKFEKMNKTEEKEEPLSSDDKLHMKSLLSKMKDILGDKVTEVKDSERLQDSPACLVNPDGTMSASMQKIMQMVNKDASIPKRVLEINTNHKIVKNLLKVFKQNPNNDYLRSVTEQLFETSLLLDGYLQDPHLLVSKVNKLLEDSSDWYTELKKM